MAEPRLTVAVLAAGQSQRFGRADKLAADLCGRPLGTYVATTLAALPFADRWVIAARADPACLADWQAAGFAVVVNDRAADGMGTSLACAARLAIESGADALLVALADMPLVPVSHFAALLARAAEPGARAIVASSGNGQRSPPAIFARQHLPELALAAGDTGARHLLAQAAVIDCAPELLIDIDDPATLAALAARLVRAGKSC